MREGILFQTHLTSTLFALLAKCRKLMKTDYENGKQCETNGQMLHTYRFFGILFAFFHRRVFTLPQVTIKTNLDPKRTGFYAGKNSWVKDQEFLYFSRKVLEGNFEICLTMFDNKYSLCICSLQPCSVAIDFPLSFLSLPFLLPTFPLAFIIHRAASPLLFPLSDLCD